MKLSDQLENLISAIPAFDQSAAAAARLRQDTLTKPQGSLGDLETLSIQIAGITGKMQAPIGSVAVVLAAASHGICAEGVSAFPTEITAQMVANFLNGSAAINVLAQNSAAEVFVVDAGVGPGCPDDAKLYRRGFGEGTANFAKQSAMSRERTQSIIEQGFDFAQELQQKGIAMISLGEMGIGNTSAAAAITSVITDTPASVCTGRGTMIDEGTWHKKVTTIEAAIDKHRPDPTDAINILSSFGGYETGFLCGCILGAASCRMPVILDGYPTSAAALLAELLSPGIRKFLIAGHCSVEPGHRLALAHLDLKPLLNLSMRLGEGSGAALAIPIVRAAVHCLNQMATFEAAAVAGKQT